MTASTQDEELKKFSRLADRWWDPDGEMRPLHDINPLRTSYVDARAPLDGARVADVGCGAGILTEAMAQRGAQVTGIDLAEDMVDAAIAHARESELDIDYRCIPSRELATECRGQFDVVTCMEMLEHVDEPATVVDDCCQMLRPGGTAVFSTINRSAKAWLAAIAGAEYILALLPRGTHDFNKLIKPSELARWARHSGLEVRAVDGMRYNPFTHHGALEERPDVNYFLYATRPENP